VVAALLPEEGEQPPAAAQALEVELVVAVLLPEELKPVGAEQVAGMPRLLHFRPASLPMDRFPMRPSAMWDPGFPEDCPIKSGPQILWHSARRTSAKTIRTRTACRWDSCSFTRIPNREKLSKLPV